MTPAKRLDFRQIVSRETGTVQKDWGGRLPVALVYPNEYYLGMSNLGVHLIYSLLNSYPDVVCERFFLEKGSTRALLSLESGRPLSDFAVAAFSLTYEFDFFNIAPILRSSGIPVFSDDRDETHPLLIAGGACITANPMPVARFFDCLCIGDAEPILPDILPALREGVGGSREELLKELSGHPGIYAPRFYSGVPVKRQWAEDLDDFPVHTAVLTPDTELGNLYLIEAERGCGWGCRFCMVGTAFSPFRYRSAESLIAQAREGLKCRKRIGLVGPAVCDHPRFEEIAEGITGLGAGLSVSSLRIRPFSPLALKALIASGSRTIALAPEAGSQRMRDVIRKNIDKDDILSAVRTVAGEGVKNLKLYFMVGLPSETDEDIEETVRLVISCKDQMNEVRPGGRISLSISPFVPKAGTPFQWMPMERVGVLDGRINRLKSALTPLGVDIKAESPYWSEVQAVLARGDASLSELLADVGKITLAGWRKAVNEHQIDIEGFHRAWALDEELPWSVIDSGIASSRLESEFNKGAGRE